MTSSFFSRKSKIKNFLLNFLAWISLTFSIRKLVILLRMTSSFFRENQKFFNSYLFGIIKDVRLWDESKFFVLNMKKHEFSGSNLKIIGIISSLNFKGLIWSVYDGLFLSVLVCFRCMGGYLRWKPDFKPDL